MTRSNDRTELVQGTLDMLVLRTLRSGQLHGYAIANRIQEESEGILQVEGVRSTRPCTAWSGAAGSRPNGGCPTAAGKPNTTN